MSGRDNSADPNALGHLPASLGELERLGERLVAGTTSDRDELLLQRVLAVYDDVLAHVSEQLRALGLHPTGRLKNRATILEKIQRGPTALGKIRDIAGCRVIVDAGRLRQRAVSARIRAHLGDESTTKVVDRLQQPMFGYRALHLEHRVKTIRVEIQVRTQLQHEWAEAYEKFGDLVGRWVRYGEEPDERWSRLGPEAVHVATSFRDMLIRVSDVIARSEESLETVEHFEAELAKIHEEVAAGAAVAAEDLERVELELANAADVERADQDEIRVLLADIQGGALERLEAFRREAGRDRQ